MWIENPFFHLQRCCYCFPFWEHFLFWVANQFAATKKHPEKPPQIRRLRIGHPRSFGPRSAPRKQSHQHQQVHTTRRSNTPEGASISGGTNSWHNNAFFFTNKQLAAFVSLKMPYLLLKCWWYLMIIVCSLGNLCIKISRELNGRFENHRNNTHKGHHMKSWLIHIVSLINLRISYIVQYTHHQTAYCRPLLYQLNNHGVLGELVTHLLTVFSFQHFSSTHFTASPWCGERLENGIPSWARSERNSNILD